MKEKKLHDTYSKRTNSKRKGRKNEIDVQRHTIQRKEEDFDNDEEFDNVKPNVNSKIP